MESQLKWIGDPILYKRPGGSSLIVGKYHYLFDTDGALSAMQPLSRPVIASVLSTVYPNSAMAMAAKLVQADPVVEASPEAPPEEGAQNG